MPEKCLFCGEVAVIEDSVAGGSDQLICVECGTIAGGNNYNSRSCHGNGIEDDDNLQSNNDNVVTDGSASSQTSILQCSSCGVDLIVSSGQGGRSSFHLLNQPTRSLCLDCADLEEEEDGESDVDTRNAPCTGGDGSEVNAGLSSCSQPGQTCTSCGCGSLVVDSVNGDDRLVCVACGHVNSDAILTSEANFNGDVGMTSSKYHSTTMPYFAGKRYKELEGVVAGVAQISILCSKFCFPSIIESESEAMYRRIYRHPNVLKRTLRKKKSLAAVCLFFVCRRFDVPISVTHFRKEVTCFSDFLKMKAFLQRCLSVTLPHMSVSSLIRDLMEQLGFDFHLTNKVKDLLFLFRKAWLCEGRNRKSLISIAAYYAYLSSDRCNKHITIIKFFSKHNMGHPPRQLAKECQNTLTKLATSLPWVQSKTLLPKQLPVYIDSILKYRDSLFHLVFKDDQGLEGDSNSMISCITQTSRGGDADVSGGGDGSSGDCSVRKNGCGENVPVKASKRTRALVPDSNKLLLLPPAIKRARANPEPVCNRDKLCAIPKGVNLDSPILQTWEFDDEMENYILTDDEKERISDPKMTLFRHV